MKRSGMGHAEEVDLLTRARQGDPSARETLYLTYFSGNKQVRNLLAREIRNPADREDILHDSWLSLVRSTSEFRGDSRLQTFIYRVVQIAILQKHRSDRAAREDKMVRLSYQFQGEERERELAIRDYQFDRVDAGRPPKNCTRFCRSRCGPPFACAYRRSSAMRRSRRRPKRPSIRSPREFSRPERCWRSCSEKKIMGEGN